jgi:hypothetical protein
LNCNRLKTPPNRVAFFFRVALYDLPNNQNLAAFSPAMKRRQRAAETHFELLEIDIKTQGRPFAPAIASSQSAAGFSAQNSTREALFRAGRGGSAGLC